jgi:hypothetical protein
MPHRQWRSALVFNNYIIFEIAYLVLYYFRYRHGIGTAVAVLQVRYTVLFYFTTLLREVYDIIYESSYRIMGDNLGGGKAGEPLIGIWGY